MTLTLDEISVNERKAMQVSENVLLDIYVTFVPESRGVSYLYPNPF